MPSSSSSLTQIELLITHIGGLGDGIGHYQNKTVFVPYTCPGDKIVAEIESCSSASCRARLVEILQPSPHRQSPACPHFTRCGGCSLQQLSASTYLEVKQQMLTHILSRLGVNSSVAAPIISIGAATRRRATFKVQVRKGSINIGFYAAQSNELIDLTQCPVMENNISSLLQPIKRLLSTFKKPSYINEIHITALSGGCDILLSTAQSLLSSDTEKLTEFCKLHSIIRVSEQKTDGTLKRIFGPVQIAVTFGGVEVALPANAFLQASSAGETALIRHVVTYLEGSRIIADLFCGCGTYSFPLLQQAQSITAYEGMIEMVTAMHNAIHHHQLDGKISTQCRDLHKNPLTRSELTIFDGAVINPPYNGAMPQIHQLSQSSLNTIVMVSCNPATFERDAKILLQGGYKLTHAVAIDQFYWSSHLELIGHFSRSG